MCFAPQRRTLFRHRNSYKCSWAEVFCTFWLRNVLRAVCFVHFDLEMCLTACNFSSLILASWRRFREPTFDPSGRQIIGKTQCLATFLPFRAPGSSFFWDILFFDLLSSFFFLLLFSSLTLPISAFHLSISSEIWLQNFLRPFQIKSYCIIT